RAKGPAPEARKKRPLLILEGQNIDSEGGRSAALTESASDLEPIDNPHRAIKPTSLRNGIRMGANDHRARDAGVLTIDIADAVDPSLQTCLAQPPDQPSTRFDIGWRKR